MNSYTVQIKSVWPGKIGGAIFKAYVLGETLEITCKAKSKVIDRLPEVGEIWAVSGTFVNHGSYGSQLSITQACVSHLPSAMYLEAILLKHPAFRGFHFGRAKIDKLIKTFGSEGLIDILDKSKIDQLSAVLDGSIAERLSFAWQSLSNEIETLSFLREHKFDGNLSREILKISKLRTVSRLKENPYALICFYHRSEKNWNTIDAAATKLKIDLYDKRRLIGAVEFILYNALAEGHTAIPHDKLLNELTRILAKNELARRAISETLDQKYICAFSKKSDTYLQLISVAYIEHSIETKIAALLQTTNPQLSVTLISRTIKAYLKAFNLEYGYSLSSQQESAIELALTERCALLSGFGGTGKTTTLKAIADVATSLGKRVILTALSGKAKERLAQATGRDASTIHSFIIGVTSGSLKIESDSLIIVDEASMIDAILFNRLLSVLENSTYSLLMVGDTAQLSPIGFGLIWHKIIESSRIKAVHLTEVYRQVEGSPLHIEAMQVRNGLISKLPLHANNANGIYLEDASESTILQKIIALKAQYPDAQIITPFVSGKDGDCTETLNKVLQEHLNSFNSSEFNITLSKTLFRRNDPIIFTRNNYELNLFNGTTGLIEEIFLNSDQKCIAKIKLIDSDEVHLLNENDLYELGAELAYAISVHKSQGSEYQKVIFCCVRNTSFIERSLVYTAITRAKNLCVVVGSQSNYANAVAKPSRASTLCVGINL